MAAAASTTSGRSGCASTSCTSLSTFMVGSHDSPPSAERRMPPTCTLARSTSPSHVEVSDRTSIGGPTWCQSSRPGAWSNDGSGTSVSAFGPEHARVGGAREHRVARARERHHFNIGTRELSPLTVGAVLPYRVAVDDRDPRPTRPRRERVDVMPGQRVIPSTGGREHVIPVVCPHQHCHGMDGTRNRELSTEDRPVGWLRGHPQGVRDRDRVRGDAARCSRPESGPGVVDADQQLRRAPQGRLGLRRRVTRS